MKGWQDYEPSFTDHILPSIRDVPEIECIILENPDLGGPFGARGVDEPPLIGCGPAILSAIYATMGKSMRALPATPDRVWRTIQRFEEWFRD